MDIVEDERNTGYTGTCEQCGKVADEIEAIGKRQQIYRKADEIRKNSNPDAANIAAIYEKYSLMNVKIGLENRRKIRAGIFLTTPANNQNVGDAKSTFIIGAIRMVQSWFRC